MFLSNSAVVVYGGSAPLAHVWRAHICLHYRESRCCGVQYPDTGDEGLGSRGTALMKRAPEFTDGTPFSSRATTKFPNSITRY